jgi:drug/metabolite transporter (DMT)-like permease
MAPIYEEPLRAISAFPWCVLRQAQDEVEFWWHKEIPHAELVEARTALVRNAVETSGISNSLPSRLRAAGECSGSQARMSLPAATRPESIALGVTTIVATALAMSFGDALVKHVSSDFTVWQIYVLRSLLAIPLIVAILRLGPRPARLWPRSAGWAGLRSLLLMLMWLAFYAALSVLSLPVVAAAYYTAPLFITLFSALIAGDAVGTRRWIAILSGFGGVLVILQPGGEAFSWLTLLPILSAVFYALAAIVTRTRCAEERPLVLSLMLNVAFLLTGAIGSAVILLWAPSAGVVAASPFLLGGWSAMEALDWQIIAMLAILIVAISAGVAKAYQCAPPAIVATFDYSYLVFAAGWSFAIFSELPDVPTVAGMILIAGAGLLVLSQSRAGA